MLSIVSTYKIWFTIAAIMMIASLALFFTWGLKVGIDFRGGSLYEVEFADQVDPQALARELEERGISHPIVQPVTDKSVIIKTEVLDEDQKDLVRKLLTETFGTFKENRFESIGPAIGKELARKAYWQIGLVVLGILLYITYSFRQIGRQTRSVKLSAWHLGAASIIALIHDILIPVGVFVLLGRFRGVEVDALFITALLTVLGFSIHDSIVVFDRIRENLLLHPYKSFKSIIDYSINSTLARSINTSATLIFVMIAMLLFGGETVFYFVLALLVGVVAGAYSSIFIASPLLYLWAKKD